MKTCAASEPPKTSTRPTSQRNENSVLFSLATLQQLSSLKEAPAASVGARPGAKPKSSVDDILAVGASSGLSSPLAMPVLAAPVVTPLAPPRPAGASTSTTAAIVAAAFIVSLGGLGAMALYLRRPAPIARVVASSSNSPKARPASPERAPAPSALPESTLVPSPGPSLVVEAASHRDRGRDRAHVSSPAVRAPARTIAPSPSPVAPTPSSNATRRPIAREETIEEIMRRAVVTPTTGPTAVAPPAPTAAGSNLPNSPARSDVIAAMRGVGPAVRSCGTGQGGTVMATVVFNSQGTVNTANVAPPAAGTAVGSCIARAVRGARLPPFARPTFSVTFPFPLD